MNNGKVIGCNNTNQGLAYCKDCVMEYAKCPLSNLETKDDSVSVYEEKALAIGKLVSEKQIQYGDSFGNAGRILSVLYPNGISIDQIEDALVIIRIIDKLFRIANGNQGNEDAFSDIVGYGLLSVVRNEKC